MINWQLIRESAELHKALPDIYGWAVPGKGIDIYTMENGCVKTLATVKDWVEQNESLRKLLHERQKTLHNNLHLNK